MNLWQKTWLASQYLKYRLVALWWSITYNIFLRLHPGCTCKGWVKVTGPVDFRIHPFGRLIIATRVRINSGSLVNAVGGQGKTIIAVHKTAILEIGEGSGISSATIVAHSHIQLDSDVMIGGGAAIYDSDYHPIKTGVGSESCQTRSKAVRISAGAFIGSKAIILKGVTVGERAVIGAGSVVTKSIPPLEVWAGCPARRIRSSS